QQVTRIVKGYPHREWVKIRERNEALDCRCYARAAATAIGIDRYQDVLWKQIEDEFGIQSISKNKNQPAKINSQKITKPQPQREKPNKKKRETSHYWNRWR